MIKLSIIRGKDVASCPYNLPIPSACSSVGSAITGMTPIEKLETKDAVRIIQQNMATFIKHSTKERCPYANSIMEKRDKVDCSFSDAAAGEGIAYLPTSPFYPRIFIGGDGVAPNPRGQDVYDPRLLYEGPERGIDVPFGLYSIFANRSNESALLRMADCRAENEKMGAVSTNKSANVRAKLALLRAKYFDVLNAIMTNHPIMKLSNDYLSELLIVIDDWTKGS